MSEFLYGTDIDDEYLHADPDDAIERLAEFLDAERIPFTGRVHRYTICPPGFTQQVSIPDGRDIVQRIVEDFGEDCGFEDLFDDYDQAADDPDVVAAFQAARDLLVSKQKFRIADQLDARATFEITAIDEDGVATYTIADWGPA